MTKFPPIEKWRKYKGGPYPPRIYSYYIKHAGIEWYIEPVHVAGEKKIEGYSLRIVWPGISGTWYVDSDDFLSTGRPIHPYFKSARLAAIGARKHLTELAHAK
jgi:hypothetical protein